MKAVWYDKNGAAQEVLQIGERAKPSPAAGEVLVRLFASGLNPSDVKARAGATRKIAFPFIIPNSDGAGIIEAVGAGVDRTRVGQKVWVYNAQWERAFGTSAEYVALPEVLAPALPDGLSFAQGACLGIPVLTAHRCIFAEGSPKGKAVLVTGGAGVVGHYAIQLARWGGARLVACTVSSEAKANHARMAGADIVIDYRRENVAEALLKATDGRGIDCVADVDLGANFPEYLPALATEASVTAYASMRQPAVTIPFYQVFRANLSIRPALVYSLSRTTLDHAIADIARWCAETRPAFSIAEQFPLASAIAAHECVEAGTKLGHVVLTIE
ncbi:NADPH:quinone reductase [Ferrovibrio sp.]|uniref:NADPH:quinone reductase n=1 Tax=Ferrovibrio sp. TaxID=1917215 RepID=UPI003D2B8F86